MSTTTGALIVGSTQAAVQVALDLARSGIPVTLAEPTPFLGTGRQPSVRVPQLLELIKHPNVTVISSAQTPAVTGRAGAFHAEIQRKTRYVSLDRCTGCGDCVAVCPMPLPDPQTDELGERRAIFKPTPQAVPNVFAIEKSGTAPCRNACPIDQRAQGYIALVREGRFADAYLAIKQENPFPSVCGRVCNHRCEAACNRGRVDKPVNVMALKRFVADWAATHPAEIAAVMPQANAPSRGKHVAIIGAGPAGLTCALDLVRLGYQATVFEAQPVAGGMMRLGVPDHRLPPEVVQREVDEIVAAGVELVLDHRVDDMGALLRQGYDAIFIAVGAHVGVELPIHGRNLPDVHRATDFLRVANLGWPVNVKGRRVLVIGGGNVGLDVAQVAVRCGASWVGMACLESREAMPAFEWEIRDAEEEGVQLFPGRSFKEITGASYVDGEWVTGVRCVQVDFRGFVNGRPDMDEVPGSEERIPADVVVFAVGQWPDLAGAPEGLEKYRGHWLLADQETQITNLPGVTAGGDVVTGTSFIVDAIAAGHKAAFALDTYLRTGVPAGWQATNPHQQVVELAAEEARVRLGGRGARYAADLPRHELPKLPVVERVQGFMEMYGNLTAEEAIVEARRCLVCGACSECLACVRVCQAEAIDHYQSPQRIELEAGVVIWADGAPPAGLGGAGVYPLAEGGLPAAAVAAQAMADLVWQRRPFPAERRPAARAIAPRTGVFICRCGDKIGGVLDVERLVAAAGALPHVVLADELPFACRPGAASTIKDAVAGQQLNRLVLAACSCCSLDQVCDSCTYQRVRCKRNLLGKPFDPLNLLARAVGREGAVPAVEFVNIREQCAWAHRDAPGLATAKAARLIAAAVAKVGLIPDSSRPAIDLDGRVLVAGVTEAAVACADVLRRQSLAVAHSDELPPEIGGTLGQLTATLRSGTWQWQVEASAAVLFPADEGEAAGMVARPGVLIGRPGGDPQMAGAALAAEVAVMLSGGRALADCNVAQVDPLRCLGCGTCQSVCQYLAVRLVEVERPVVRDPGWELLQLADPAAQDEEVQWVAQVNPALCQGCGTCAAHCPSSAIAAGYATDQQIEVMLAALLA